MTSLQIVYFLKAAESMSFSGAAQALYVTQPSVSRQIKLLEKELGYALFDRTRKNALRLTAEGIIFRDAFSQIQRQYTQAADLARELSGQSPMVLRVGVGSGWDLSRELMQARREIEASFPQAQITFESQDFRELRSQIRDGKTDVILCTKTSLMDFDGLEVAEIANLESRAYVRKGLLRPAGEALVPSDFAGQRLLMLSESESPMAMELALLQFQARQVAVVPRYMPNRDSILQALLLGEGVTVFDQYMRFSSDPRLDWLNLEDDIPICLVWNKGNSNPLIRLFADIMIRAMGSSGTVPYVSTKSASKSEQSPQTAAL